MPKGKKSRRPPPEPVGPEVLAARAAGKVVTLKRSEAISRLLDMAISLWFTGNDPVCVHILVFAPYHCLEVIGKDAGIGPVLLSRMDRDKFTLAYDFLRHASTDLKATLDFPPVVNPMLLFDAIGAFERIFRTTTIPMRTLTAYVMAGFIPDFELSAQALQGGAQFLPESLTLRKAGKLSRIEFYRKVTRLFAVQQSGIIPIPILRELRTLIRRIFSRESDRLSRGV